MHQPLKIFDFVKKMTPKPPKSLSREARKIWLQIAYELDQVDGSAQLLLDMLAQTFDRRQAARAEIAKSADGGIFFDRFKQPKVAPNVLIEQSCTLTIIRLCHSLGLDMEPGDMV